MLEPITKRTERYFYCFKFFEEEPFRVHPYAFSIMSEDGNSVFDANIAEGLAKIPDALRSTLNIDTDISVMQRDHIAIKMYSFLRQCYKLELWSFQDIHCRHFFAEMFGGMDGNSNVMLRQAGFENVLHRDLQHIYVGLNRPKAWIGENPKDSTASDTAKWMRNAFFELRNMARSYGIHSVPMTDDVPGVERTSYDTEYWRVEPNVLLPLSTGFVSMDGKRQLHVAYKDHIALFNEMHPNPDILAGHEAFLAHHVLPKIVEDRSVVWGSDAEIFEEIAGFIPRCDVWEPWSDHDTHDRRMLGCHQFAAEDGGKYNLFSELRHRGIVGAILPRDLSHTRVLLGYPPYEPQRDHKIAHSALQDAGHNREVFNHFRMYAREKNLSAEAIVPSDFKLTTPDGQHLQQSLP